METLFTAQVDTPGHVDYTTCVVGDVSRHARPPIMRGAPERTRATARTSFPTRTIIVKIGIPTFGCDSGRSGIGRYLQQALHQVAAQAPHHDLHLIGAADDVVAFGRGTARTCVVPSSLCGVVPNVAWHATGLPLHAARQRLDLLFLPAANRRLPLWSPCPTVGTVHDLSALRVHHKYDRVHEIYLRHVVPAMVRRLTRIVTVSECSRRDIVALVGVPAERVTVIPNGVDTNRMAPLPREVAFERLTGVLPDRRPYLLYVSRVEHPGKNHVRLIEAFARLKLAHAIPHRLVLAGPLCERADEVTAAADASGAGPDIMFTGFVADDDLRALYAAADIFVFPSLYEGFGIPLLEAMACATPVVTANTSSLPEVGGDAALYFDPHDALDLCATLRRVIDDSGLRHALVTAGLARSRCFSWAECGRRLLQVFEDATDERRHCAAASQETPGDVQNPWSPCPSSENPRRRQTHRRARRA